MKKHIILTFTIAVLLGWAIDPVASYFIDKYHHHPIAVIASYGIVLLLVGVPVLFMLQKRLGKITE